MAMYRNVKVHAGKNKMCKVMIVIQASYSRIMTGLMLLLLHKVRSSGRNGAGEAKFQAIDFIA
ncbi:hypothetical protein [Klebsiella quasipneumoniae]|uniref:hypothetical protein n=1 Tax=Klebsiella quasipneumoniae TaxID=1463165 RepID=UPI0035A00A46